MYNARFKAFKQMLQGRMITNKLQTITVTHWSLLTSLCSTDSLMAACICPGCNTAKHADDQDCGREQSWTRVKQCKGCQGSCNAHAARPRLQSSGVRGCKACQTSGGAHVDSEKTCSMQNLLCSQTVILYSERQVIAVSCKNPSPGAGWGQRDLSPTRYLSRGLSKACSPRWL